MGGGGHYPASRHGRLLQGQHHHSPRHQSAVKIRKSGWLCRVLGRNALARWTFWQSPDISVPCVRNGWCATPPSSASLNPSVLSSARRSPSRTTPCLESPPVRSSIPRRHRHKTCSTSFG